MTEMHTLVSLEIKDQIAVVCIDNPPVNALGQEVRKGLRDCFATIENDAAIRAVVLVGQGRAFIAGADIKEFGKPPAQPLLPDICLAIENCDRPVIASLHGVCLGGGLEVALAAHYRIAQPDARMGLPEVNLGLIPGAGGTQRLPRLIGTQAAVLAITSGRHIPAQEALELGLLDEVRAGDPETVGVEYAQELLSASATRRPVGEMPAPKATDWDAARTSVLKKARGRIAPLQAIRAIQASTEVEFEEGLRKERAIFSKLMETDQRAALIHAFFAERAVSRLPELKDITPKPVSSLGVVGGGTMGAGIATAALLAELNVTLVEQSPEAVTAARNRILANLDGAVKRGKISASDFDHMCKDKLVLSETFEALRKADLVIEAVFEDMKVKQAVFSKLQDVCAPDTILATNTSYLDVDEIAAGVSKPERVIGLHFFSPAHVMKLLEVVVPEAAAAQTVATGFALGAALGKTAVRAGVCDGFIGNRLLNAYRTAADHMVLDGATPFEIDDAVVTFGFPMGPFQVSDLAGLDIGWAMRKRRAAGRDPRERVGRYADVLCEAGHFGRKTGRGFYLYDDASGAGTPNKDVLSVIASERKERNITPRPFSREEIQRRYMAAMVNEAAKIIAEGIARRPLDVDVVLMAGYGFPRYLGGPCKWADLTGLASLLRDIEGFARDDAFFWQPAALLQDLVSRGGTFDELNR